MLPLVLFPLLHSLLDFEPLNGLLETQVATGSSSVHVELMPQPVRHRLLEAVLIFPFDRLESFQKPTQCHLLFLFRVLKCREVGIQLWLMGLRMWLLLVRCVMVLVV